jgi:hypothetical protein
MSIFKRNKKELEEERRTKIEKQFEDKGQEIGRKTGNFVQKSVDKYGEVKDRLESEGKLDKLRNFTSKVDDTIDQVVDKVSKKGRNVVKKISKKKDVEKENEFYE